MSLSPILSATSAEGESQQDRAPNRGRRRPAVKVPLFSPARMPEIDATQRHAELFYLQKQIQAQTPMVIILEDGEQVEGHIEWYDRNTIKLRGRTKTLIYKSAIKYMYKLSDVGQ